MQFHPSPAVRHKTIDGLVVILDLGSGSYRILNEVASATWQACVENTGDEGTLDRLADRFDAEPSRLRSDFDSFRRDCIEKGLLVSAQRDRTIARSPLARVMFPTWHAWMCLVRTAVSLRWHGFGRTYLHCAGLASCGHSEDVDRVLPQALEKFLLAENLAPLKRAPKDCLPRSLALFRFLRDMRLPVEHCIGVERYPFQAHAWVECRGEVLLDVDRRAQFATLARIEA